MSSNRSSLAESNSYKTAIESIDTQENMVHNANNNNNNNNNNVIHNSGEGPSFSALLDPKKLDYYLNFKENQSQQPKESEFKDGEKLPDADKDRASLNDEAEEIPNKGTLSKAVENFKHPISSLNDTSNPLVAPPDETEQDQLQPQQLTSQERPTRRRLLHHITKGGSPSNHLSDSNENPSLPISDSPSQSQSPGHPSLGRRTATKLTFPFGSRSTKSRPSSGTEQQFINMNNGAPNGLGGSYSVPSTPTDDTGKHRFANTGKKLLKFRKRKDKHQINSKFGNGASRKAEHELDIKNQLKTEQIINAMVAGFPSAIMISNYFTNDELGQRRIPMLLPLLSLTLTDITVSKTTKKRKFQVDLEYGLGSNVLRWSLLKTLKELSGLHRNIKYQLISDNLTKNVMNKGTQDSTVTKDKEKYDHLLPEFPKYENATKRGLNRAPNTRHDSLVTLPRLSLDNRMQQQQQQLQQQQNGRATLSKKSQIPPPPPIALTQYNGVNGTPSKQPVFQLPPLPTPGTQSHPAHHRPSNSEPFANNSSGDEYENFDDGASISSEMSKKHYFVNKVKSKLTSTINYAHAHHHQHNDQSNGVLSQQQTQQNSPEAVFQLKLQKYFDELLSRLTFSSQANRIFQFFELSPVSVLLSNENGKKRKEGYLYVTTKAADQGWRVGHLKARDWKAMVQRHSAKWFVVGHSYIMYVADINSTTPLDVFLVDSKFKFSLAGWSEQQHQHNNHLINNNPHSGNDKVLAPVHEDDEDEDDPNANPTSKDEADGVLDNVTEQLTGNKYKIMKLENTERKLYLTHKSLEQLKKWGDVIKKMQDESIWSQPHRFDSFAPVRQNCFAQWFVDARDYMWALSAALEMAKDVIYIHDWWLSPELYLRRPANGNQEWRIDRLLKRKAEQGVKIFVIVYRNVANTVITDSLWTKHSLLNLHENVYILRSPNQLMQSVYFWAHHEKLAIIDHSVCFVGGIDLCYGRYDTPDHVLADDAPYAFESQIPEGLSQEDRDALEFQKFPGKDYSNPRKKDFFDLDKPFEDMYDRMNVPRMPWHDVHMLTSGHIARDLSRHFAQRWNYILRQKRPSRPTPLLIPPRDYTDDEIQELGLGGTCEVQLLRSSCDWSLGLQDHEQSIQNAYIKCIETSEHFVYMENQFFVTSCDVDGVLVKNKIGDALVDRVIRAHKLKETWKCVIVIPLMPGFEAQVDSKDGSAVRVIMQCQYMSISMGDSSIFAKLRRVGIKPEDYIQFFSLRKWSYIGKNDLLVSEQLYIHAKTMVVDDRIAIIGSANINERSMRGTRDSEVCAIVRDKDMIDSRMDDKPYKVGKFAHTLRMRLMREHLGVDVDLFEMVERRFSQIEDFANEKGLKASTLQNQEGDHGLSAKIELGIRYLLHQEGNFDDGTPVFKAILNKPRGSGKQLTKAMFDSFDCLSTDNNLDDIPFTYSFNHRAGEENVGIREKKNFSTDPRVTTQAHYKEIEGLKDRFTSQMYINSKKKIDEALKELSSFTFGPSGLDKNLPDYQDVVEYLTHPTSAGESIDIVNADRWIMIKRLFYIQKLINKEALSHSKKMPSSRDTAAAVTTSAFNGSSQASPNNTRFYEGPTTPNDLQHQHSQQLSQLNSSEMPSSSGLVNGLPSGSGSGLGNGIGMEGTGSGTGGPGIANAVAAGITKAVHLTDVDIEHIDKNTLPQTEFQFLDPFGFSDPLAIEFYEGLWMPQAIRNTMIYQMVFHCQPDDSVQMWKDYKAFEELRLAFTNNEKIRSAGCNDNNGSNELNNSGGSADFFGGLNPGSGSGTSSASPINNDNNHNGSDDVLELLDAYNANGESTPDSHTNNHNSSNHVTSNFDQNEMNRVNKRKSRMAQLERYQKTSRGVVEDSDAAFNSKYGVVYDHESAEKLLGLIRGHLVQFPTRWLKKEVEGGNWFYKADKLPPVQIYN